MATVHEVTDANFETMVLKADTPVLVDFWAPWCGPCRMVAPVVEKIAAKFEGKCKVTKLNVDEASATATKFGIRSIPTLMLFKNGQMVEQMVGLQSESALSDMITKAISG